MLPQVNTPRVSVVVPAYSRVHYLRECLASIKAQTIPDWECIVVDDASPAGDAIRDAVERMEDARFRYIRRNRNGGPGAARNTGIEFATAEYFMCVDEDDRILPNSLAVLLREIEKYELDVICPQARFFGGREGLRKAYVPSLEMVLMGMCVIPNGWMMRRSLWYKIGGYDEDERLLGRDDWEFWIRIVEYGAAVRVIEEVLYEIRVPEGGLGQRGSLEHEVLGKELMSTTYVLRKHERTYRRFPDIRRGRMVRAVRKERDWYVRNNQFLRAAFRSVQLFFYRKQFSDLVMVVKSLIGMMRIRNCTRPGC